ncbi:MAG TPA: hypothetical protein VFV45_05065 [Rubrobacteraceae bacterium]|nr:hypothetical protein [Rubrobacteraceae bacterium]
MYDYDRSAASKPKQKKQTEAEYQSSDEYKTSKDPDYYPKKAPAGMKYPSELNSLGPLKAVVLSMFEEDLDKNRAYKHPAIKKLQKSLAKRFESEEDGDEVLEEMRRLQAFKEKMSEKMRDAKTDAAADPYRFAMRKVYHAWQGYNAALQDNQDRGNRET